MNSNVGIPPSALPSGGWTEPRKGDNPDIAKNEAFILSSPETRELYDQAYTVSSTLYYGDTPTFEQIMAGISAWADRP